jgi:C-terminal processing protease CtpA/Prc
MKKLSIVVLIVLFFGGVLYFAFHHSHKSEPAIPSSCGIGAALAVKNHALQILDVLPRSPARKAGLHAGLIIQQIDDTDIAGKPLAECINLIRGPVGSKVRLQVLDPAKGETNYFEIIREKIQFAKAGSPPR